jgi:hypothetical protein
VFYVADVGPLFSWLFGGVVVIELVRWAWGLFR